MNNPQLTRVPIAKTGMLIRKPIEQVFEAIVNPEITSKFWFGKGSGRLETGKNGIGNKRVLLIEWPGYSGPTIVEWAFASRANGTTFVRVLASGWTGEGDKLAQY